MKIFVIISCLQIFALSSYAHVINFHIGQGTIEKPWNTRSTTINAKVGDTIRFFNDDSVVHRLHTYGAPCDHGPDFEPGAHFDCVATSSYSAKIEGPLYDHNYGESAEVWFEVVE